VSSEELAREVKNKEEVGRSLIKFELSEDPQNWRGEKRVAGQPHGCRDKLWKGSALKRDLVRLKIYSRGKFRMFASL